MRAFSYLGIAILGFSTAQLNAASYCSQDGKVRCTIEYVSENGEKHISIDEENKENLEWIAYTCDGNEGEWGFAKEGEGNIVFQQSLSQEELNSVSASKVISHFIENGLKGTVQSGRFSAFNMFPKDDVGIFRLYQVTTDQMNFVGLVEDGGNVLFGAKEFCS